MNLKWDRLLCDERIRTARKRVNGLDLRSEFERDYHRIISSASFRRLQDKTQVFPLDQSDFVRTRLTHSLEVSSFGKSFGQSISAKILYEIKDPDFRPEYLSYVCDILQCAGLIHDIGNPPFGHFGETAIRQWFLRNMPSLTYHDKKVEDILSEQMKHDFYHFEGNTQAFRLVTKLHFLVDANGMNLTKALLATMIKYPVSSLEINTDGDDIVSKKMGYYYADRDNFAKVQEAVGTNGRRHPLAYALEAADDVAYRTADIEDGFRKGLISYSYLKEELETFAQRGERQKELADLLSYRFQKGIERDVSNPKQYAVQNWLVTIQSKAISAATESFGAHYDEIMSGAFKNELLSGTPEGELIDLLGDIAVEKIFHSDMIYEKEIAEEVILDFLLDKFIDAAIYYDTDTPLKPVQVKLMSLVSENYKSIYRIFSEGKPENEKLYLRLLLITDYICGMTDSYAKTLYQKLNGII